MTKEDAGEEEEEAEEDKEDGEVDDTSGEEHEVEEEEEEAEEKECGCCLLCVLSHCPSSVMTGKESQIDTRAASLRGGERLAFRTPQDQPPVSNMYRRGGGSEGRRTVRNVPDSSSPTPDV